MHFDGIPLHPLVIHAAVVFVPLAALGALAYAGVRRWRWALRWPMVVASVIAAVSVQFAAMTGKSLRNELGLRSALMQEHQTWAGRLQVATWVLLALTVLAAWLLPALRRSRGMGPGAQRVSRVGALAPVLAVVLALLALAELYVVYRTGDAGARLVWQGR